MCRTIVYAVTEKKMEQLPGREELKELIKDEGIVDVVMCLMEKQSACDVLQNVHLLFLGKCLVNALILTVQRIL